MSFRCEQLSIETLLRLLVFGRHLNSGSFTDDDDDPTYDELKDLFADRKTRHLFDRTESRCRVTVFGTRGVTGHPERTAHVGANEIYVQCTLTSNKKEPDSRRSETAELDAEGSAVWNSGEGEKMTFDMTCNFGDSGANST